MLKPSIIRTCLAGALLCLSPAMLHAEGGLETSLSAEVGGKIFIKPLSWSFEEEYRMHNDLTTERFSHALTLGYKLPRFVKLQGTYNLINYHEHGTWEIRHRVQLGGSLGYETKRWELSLRSLWQNTYREGVRDYYQPELHYPDGTLYQREKARSNPKGYVRTRLEYTYNIRHSRFSPFISAEAFYLTNDYIENKIDKWRFVVGTDYKFKKRQTLSVMLRYTSAVDDDDTCPWLLGVAYKFKVK